MNLKEKVRVIEDFPKKGISFKDINSLTEDPLAYQDLVDQLYNFAQPLEVNKVVSPESRGYIVGCPLAYKLGAGFVPVRKPGKLPGEVLQESYELEYGEDTIEMQKGSIKPGDRVVIVDDLIATGGTLEATAKLIEKQGGEVAGILSFIELTDLKGSDKIKNYPFYSLVTYPV